MDYSNATFTLSSLSSDAFSFYNQFGWPLVRVVGGIAIGSLIATVLINTAKKASG